MVFVNISCKTSPLRLGCCSTSAIVNIFPFKINNKCSVFVFVNHTHSVSRVMGARSRSLGCIQWSCSVHARTYACTVEFPLPPSCVQIQVRSTGRGEGGKVQLCISVLVQMGWLCWIQSIVCCSCLVHKPFFFFVLVAARQPSCWNRSAIVCEFT